MVRGRVLPQIYRRPSALCPEIAGGVQFSAIKVERGEASTPAASAPPRHNLIFRENIRYVRLRRVLDASAALIVLVVVTPILLAASFAILLEDGRPIFFRQQRVGRFGRLFNMYKLRTMQKTKCVDNLSPTSGRDPRITRVGHWLRKSSIDELPQLINVICGEMTFVGPRPEMPFLVREYEPWQHLRHLVTPGVTGFWQTTCRSTVPLHLPEATMLDLEYVRNASYLTDRSE